jgi:hypothetical protein
MQEFNSGYFILSWFLATGKLFAQPQNKNLQPENPRVCYASVCCDIILAACAFLPILRHFCEGIRISQQNARGYAIISLRAKRKP